MFASKVGTQLDAANVRRDFKEITATAGLGRNWTPRELRHSFVSLMSDHGVKLEEIADLVGHSGTQDHGGSSTVTSSSRSCGLVQGSWIRSSLTRPRGRGPEDDRLGH